MKKSGFDLEVDCTAKTPVRTVLVTGAAGGIGFGIARQFAQLGHRLVLVDRNPQVKHAASRLADTSKQALGLVVDLACDSEILDMVYRVNEVHGGCDILVNCAAVAPKKDGVPFSLSESSTAEWDRVMRINLTAPFVLCREFMPGMQSRRFGRVVNIASVAGRTFRPHAGIDYSTSKAGLIGLTRRLAGEYAPFGVTVNCVAPGRVQTELSGKSEGEALAIAQTSIPMRRGGEIDEIAAAVLFLGSEAASFVTGACVDVNGGSLIA
jgi:3-oxoacyl-[acyl-carrier protein] reductase